MNPREFILQKLEALKNPSKMLKNINGLPVESAIEKALLSKKFRKYAIEDHLSQHIKQAIKLNVDEGKPINLTFLNGAYKLWRLDSAPEADWAELFTLMYFIKWVKPVCEIYEPGVHIDFFMDDLILPKLGTASLKDSLAYQESFNGLITFLKEYQPSNLKITLTTVGGQFDSEQDFYKLLDKEIDVLANKTEEGLVQISDRNAQMIELNTNATSEQLTDPLWKRKIWHIHQAYSPLKKSRGYHYVPNKILVFTQPLGSGTVLPVGSTKTSIMKFWVGIGALKVKNDSYVETIVSQSQLQQYNASLEEIYIKGLERPNFKAIYIVS